LNIEFPFEIIKYQSKDIKYILLNMLQSNGFLLHMVKYNLFGIKRPLLDDFISRKTENSVEYSLYLKVIFEKISKNIIKKENMPLNSFTIEEFCISNSFF
jgi:hypothetical protein